MMPAILPNNWEFYEPRRRRWFPARVPGCIHLDLQRNGIIPDPFWGSNELELGWIDECDWDYRLIFDAPGGRFDLVAEGLDTVASITLNGRQVARTENMFRGYRFPVQLRAGRNELRIRFASATRYVRQRLKPGHYPEWNDPVGGVSLIRKQQSSFGWDWAPRFPTCGIYRPIRLEAERPAVVRVRQIHRGGRVTLRVNAKHSRLMFQGKVVAEGGGSLIVRQPRLWWPNGLGEQPLYDLIADGQHRCIGLRTIQLDRHKDKWGESFQFVVNGMPVFAKGANWIPAHCFVTASRYDDLLTSAVEANMNMLRVWGGGIYESDEFYNLCDEKGLLVWQDFMFACALYSPSREIEHEAEYQVQRLAHHACLALWCGNNEIEQMLQGTVKTKARQRAYEKIFGDILPAAVKKYDGVTPYWPSSPHNPAGFHKKFQSPAGGDCHFWDVWHARKPVKRYEEVQFRFCSEFGMQSYCSPELAATFCNEMNVFSPAMENHQKNAAGNQIIFDYISQRYRFPKDYRSLAYLSQLSQAYCLKVGVEHFRRSMPRTMGALYWQLNDCWPVASWSSLEFGGRWKAAHYEARRFFAPALVTAHVPGDDRAGKGNRITSTIHDVNIYTVYDDAKPRRGRVHWTLFHLDGRVLQRGSKPVTLRYGESRLQKRLALTGRRDAYLRIHLTSAGKLLSENTVFLAAPRFMDLPRAPIQTTMKRVGSGEYELRFQSKAFQHRVEFHFVKTKYRAADNFFDLYPGEIHVVRVCSKQRLAKSALRVMSLVDSY
jgi:beta-mannosidase